MLISLNGRFLPSESPLFPASSRAIKYGDALFETIRIKDQKILFEDLHAERLQKGLQILQYNNTPEISWTHLKKEIVKLIVKNGHSKNARVRLTIIRGNGGIYNELSDNNQYLIESSPSENYRWNEKGLRIDLSNVSVKAIDQVSNIKSANYLPY